MTVLQWNCSKLQRYTNKYYNIVSSTMVEHWTTVREIEGSNPSSCCSVLVENASKITSKISSLHPITLHVLTLVYLTYCQPG